MILTAFVCRFGTMAKDLTCRQPGGDGPAGHYGLLGIQERAEAIGARLQIQSAAGAGTNLMVSQR